jgi:hypothetical protein
MTFSFTARSIIATFGSVEIRVRKIVADFGETPVDKIKPADIDAWLSKSTKTPATSNRYRALFSLIYREALRNGKIGATDTHSEGELSLSAEGIDLAFRLRDDDGRILQQNIVCATRDGEETLAPSFPRRLGRTPGEYTVEVLERQQIVA